MKRLQNCLTVLAFALVLTGCAGVGLEKAQSFSDRYDYAVATYTAAVQTVDIGVLQQQITSASAENALKQADSARLLINAANEAFGAGDVAGANTKLNAALVALTALQTYLNTLPPGKPL